MVYNENPGEGTVYPAYGSGGELRPAYPYDAEGDNGTSGDMGYVKAVGYVAGRNVSAGRGKFKERTAVGGRADERRDQRLYYGRIFRNGEGGYG